MSDALKTPIAEPAPWVNGGLRSLRIGVEDSQRSLASPDPLAGIVMAPRRPFHVTQAFYFVILISKPMSPSSIECERNAVWRSIASN